MIERRSIQNWADFQIIQMRIKAGHGSRGDAEVANKSYRADATGA